MATNLDQEIEEMLRQDTEALKLKKTRLRAFAAALEEMRRASDAVAAAASDLIEAGDMSKAELRVKFGLSNGEAAAARGSAKKSAKTDDADTTANGREHAPEQELQRADEEPHRSSDDQ